MRALLPFFFVGKIENPFKHFTLSLLWIVPLSVAGYIVALNIPIEWLANRFMHGFCGGCMALFTCFLAYKDSKMRITRFQFALFSFLVVTALGVGNEIMEFVFQNFTDAVFADTINDTWFDLISNTIGCLVAVIVLLPFLGPVEKSEQI